ncbi:MAG: hypothetical protein PHF20_10230, partial [Halothiobacillaceae bacterium]|nr:hypothetical protein [Halothiobacillaceae bacterium]
MLTPYDYSRWPRPTTPPVFALHLTASARLFAAFYYLSVDMSSRFGHVQNEKPTAEVGLLVSGGSGLIAPSHHFACYRTRNLAGNSNPTKYFACYRTRNLVARGGIEPPTRGFS